MEYSNRIARVPCGAAMAAAICANAQAPSELARATAADHRQMLQQLGITQLRNDPSGEEQAPDQANYDEATRPTRIRLSGPAAHE